MINTITINSATCSAVLSPLWQYDYGQYLKIEGIDLPQSFEVDFATIDQSSSVTMLGEDGQVKVPDDMLNEGVDITAYIYLHSDETDGYTEYVIQIPVISRPERTEETPTPQEQTLIEQAITVLNHAVEQTGQDVEAAQQAAEDAEAAASSASTSAQTASTAATSASTSATAAATSASAAATSAGQAGVSATSAAASATSAAQSASDAQSAVASIGDSVTRAESAASTATGAAQTASTKASEANTSAGVAASNATTATVKAQEAAQSTTQAAQSATAAQTAQTAAEAAQTGAQTAQAAAETAAAQAEEQADRAEGYADRLIDVYPTDTASGTIASFTDGADDVEVKSLTVHIEPVQAGSGDPSPDNVRPISGWTGANISHSGADMSNPTIIPISWESEAGTVYGGTLTYDGDGVWTVTSDRGIVTLDGTQTISRNGATATYTEWVYTPNPAKKPAPSSSQQNYGIVSNKLKSIVFTSNPYEVTGRATNANIVVTLGPDLDVTAAKAWLAANPTQIVYELAQPTTYTVTTDELLTLLGQNSIWADCGDTSVTYRADIQLYIQKMIAAALNS